MSQAIILLNTDFKRIHIEEIKKLSADYQIKFKDDLLEEDYEKVEIMYGWNKAYSPEDLEKFTDLKWIQAASAGVDYLPKVITQNPKIQISNMSGVHAVPITESVFGYLLGTGRQLFTSQLNQQKGQWVRPEHETFFSLKDKTLLVYGTGNIGQEIARVGQAFGMKIIGVNTNGRAIDCFDECVALQESNKVTAQADFIVSTLPATKDTYHYFDEDWFMNLKKTALFINIGRGQTVDETAIASALSDQKFAGAYLDVFHTEPLPEDSPLWQINNLLITPHITGHIAHFANETYPIFMENLESYLKTGNLARNIVATDKGY